MRWEFGKLVWIDFIGLAEVTRYICTDARPSPAGVKAGVHLGAHDKMIWLTF